MASDRRILEVAFREKNPVDSKTRADGRDHSVGGINHSFHRSSEYSRIPIFDFGTGRIRIVFLSHFDRIDRIVLTKEPKFTKLKTDICMNNRYRSEDHIHASYRIKKNRR